MKIGSVDLENSHYSQNGEDGIIAHLVELIRDSQYVKPGERQFVEIGCGDGSENNTTALAIQGWNGVVIDRKPSRIDGYNDLARELKFNSRVKPYHLGVSVNMAGDLIDLFETHRPCFFSLDIDGPDWHVMRSLLEEGFRPSVCCLEYNATFENRPITVMLNECPKVTDNLYYGASVLAWQRLMRLYEYDFITVDSQGVNAFFVYRPDMEMDEIAKIKGIPWTDCVEFTKQFGPAPERYNLIVGKHTFFVVGKQPKGFVNKKKKDEL